jgi:SAM-dependent methyltransferase
MTDQLAELIESDPGPWDLRLNIGSGNWRYEDCVNIDVEPKCNPDKVMDLTKKWDYDDNSVDVIRAYQVMEHFVYDDWVFVLKEMYRCCRDGALVAIEIPDPRHDEYFGDPDHKIAIMPSAYRMLDKEICHNCRDMNLGNTPFALYNDVDFRMISQETVWDYNVLDFLGKKYAEEEEKEMLSRVYNNIICKWRMIFRVKKGVYNS